MGAYDVVVIGYVKSGNTWTARLLGEILNSPVTGWGSAMPIAKEGQDRLGNYVVRQLHLRPVYNYANGEFIANEWSANISGWNGEKVVMVYRDPRDIIVSSFYYWERQTIEETIRAMYNGSEPFSGVGDYNTFVKSWRTVTEIPIGVVHYEHLVERPEEELKNLLGALGIPPSFRNSIEKAVDLQSFNRKRKEIADNPSRTEKRPYGMEIQLKNMRHGVSGDWKSHFNRKSGKLFDDLFGDLLFKLHYEKDERWYEKLQA